MDNFYSKNWCQQNVFSIYNYPHYDILVDDKSFYLIKIPSYNYGFWTFFLGGMALSIIGDSTDSKKREEYRSPWINSEGRVVSNNFEKDVFLKIPLSDLSEKLIYKKYGILSSGFILNYEGKNIMIRNNKKEFNRIIDYLYKLGIKIKVKGILG